MVHKSLGPAGPKSQTRLKNASGASGPGTSTRLEKSRNGLVWDFFQDFSKTFLTLSTTRTNTRMPKLVDSHSCTGAGVSNVIFVILLSKLNISRSSEPLFMYFIRDCYLTEIHCAWQENVGVDGMHQELEEQLHMLSPFMLLTALIRFPRPTLWLGDPSIFQLPSSWGLGLNFL